MRSSDQRQKLGEKYKWKNSQEKANFYKNKRNQLRDWLGKLPDMLLILNRLSPEQTKNIKLEDKLIDLIEFTDAFLDKANPLPVAECKNLNGRMTVFQNALVDVTGSYLVEPWKEGAAFFESPLDKRLIMPIDGRKCLMYTRFWEATKAEIHRSDVLKKHAAYIQRHIDPSVFIYRPNVSDCIRERVHLFESLPISPDGRHEFIENFSSGWEIVTPVRNMPTNPPCIPQIIIDEKKSNGDEDDTQLVYL